MKHYTTTYKKFRSKAQALAFISGIEFVNDSSIEVYYRGKHLGGYMVRIDERKAVLK